MRSLLLITCIVFASPANAQQNSQPDALILAMDREVDKMLAPANKPSADWSKGGLDLRDILKEEDGGPRIIFEPDKHAPTVIAYRMPTANLLPTGWYRVKSRSVGDQSNQEISTTVVAISPTMVIVASGSSRRVEGADCSAPDGALEVATYRHPQATGELSDIEAGMQFFIDRYFQKLATLDLCTVTRAASNGRYRMLYFVADGRSLPALNKDSKLMSVHPVSRLPALLKLKP
jgi:hypothetical protein